MPFPENSINKRLPEPKQLSHIRNHASYLLVGRVADRFFDAGWFLVGLAFNLVVVMPYLIVLALLLGRFHFFIIKNWHWAVFVGALVAFLPVLIVTQVQESRIPTRNTVASVSRVVGRMIIAFGIAVVLMLTSQTVEYFRDEFRFNELTMLSAIGGSGAVIGILGLLQRIIPEKLRRNHLFFVSLVSLSGALLVLMTLLALVNWVVYGNTLEVAAFVKFLETWSYYQIAILTIILTSSIVGLGWLHRNWSILKLGREGGTKVVQSLFGNGSTFSRCNCLYMLFIFATCLLVFPYTKANEQLGSDAKAISFGIGNYSRSLNVFAAISLSDKVQISEHTKRTIDHLRIQRNAIRQRQEYRHPPEDGGFDNSGTAHLKTFGVTQSYVDNASELYELDASEKFLLRQAVAQQSRKLLLQRSNIALGQAGGEFTAKNQWALVKPILVEQTALYLLTASGDLLLKPIETLDQIENRLLSLLLAAKVNALYQREFLDLFCPTLANRVPMPASETSSFPGTLPLFFDGIDTKDKLFIRRAVGRLLLRICKESDPRVIALKSTWTDVFNQIAAEEEIRKAIEGATDAELCELCISEPAVVVPVEASTDITPEGEVDRLHVLKFQDDIPFTDRMPINLGATWCSIPEQLGIYAASWNRDLKPTQGDVARELLIERAFSGGAQHPGSLQSLQAPEILLSDDAATKRKKYALRGKEQFAPRDLIKVAVGPFIGEGILSNMQSQVERFQQIDFVASTVAYSAFSNLEKLANTRHELFTQNFGLKGALISFVALIIGAFAVGWININRTAANEYYRLKLKQAFLTNSGGESMDIRLSDLNCPESGAPYLLINTVANLHGSDDLSLRDRKCDMFLLSGLHVGSRLTRYVDTPLWEKAVPNFQLSNAVAISAAAIGPNMGRFTSPLLVWLMSLLNIRLGYWVPNPLHLEDRSKFTLTDIKRREIRDYLMRRRGVVDGSNSDLELIGLAFPGGGIRSATFNLGIVQALADYHLLSACDYLSTVSGGGYIGSSLVAQFIKSHRDSSKPTSIEKAAQTEAVSGRHWYPPPGLLVSEMLGILREQDAWLNLSDGGHAENLAVFELLERECKLIVVGNAEAGTTNPNSGLGILIRMAKTDLGVDIVLNTNGFQLNEYLHSSSHWAVGRILYPSGTEGKLVVLRASMTGDESVAITEYKERCSMFPFESTTDQFFDVGQFEAYRLLGEHVAEDFLTAIFPDSVPGEETSVSSRCQLLLEAVNNICTEQASFQEGLRAKKGELHG
jgi:hypothetical protein